MSISKKSRKLKNKPSKQKSSSEKLHKRLKVSSTASKSKQKSNRSKKKSNRTSKLIHKALLRKPTATRKPTARLELVKQLSTPPKTDVPPKKKSSKRKDPTDALGDFISVLNTNKIDSDVDFVNINEAIKYILAESGNDIKKFTTEENFLRICHSFDLRIRELMSLMMERYPDTFGVSYMKTMVRPMVVGLIREFNEYKNGTIGYFNKPIFKYL